MTRRSVVYLFSMSLSCVLPLDSESWVRNTAVVDCMVLCMSFRRAAVGVLPLESRNVLISLMESSPILSGAGVCGADGA